MALESSLPSPFPPRAVLMDHTAFPYLIDNIFLLAPPASLIKLRLVSRAFRDRADALLAHHVYFRWSRRSRLTNYVFEGVCPGPDRHRIPGLGPDAMWSWPERYAAILGNARVVDFEHVDDAEDPNWGNLEESIAGVRLCRALVNVDTVCLRVGSRPETLRTPLRARKVIVHLYLWGAPCKAITGPPCDGVEQLVLNVGDIFNGVFPAECVSAFCTPALREIVVIFDSIRFWPPEHDQDQPREWVLTKLLWPIAALLPAIKVKFVNWVVLYPFLREIPSPRPRRWSRRPNIEHDVHQYILSTIIKALFPVNPTKADYQRCEKLMDESVSFHTLEAYRASIPEADFELETMKHLPEWDLSDADDDDDDNQGQGGNDDDDSEDDDDDDDDDDDEGHWNDQGEGGNWDHQHDGENSDHDVEE